MPYKSRMRPKRGENMIFKSWEWYYFVSMYKYYQLNLFQVLIGKFHPKPNFQPFWPTLGLLEPNKEQTWEICGSQELGVVLYRFYAQLASANFVSSLMGKFGKS